MQRGHHVIMACRDAKRCAVAKKELDARQAEGSSRGSCECAILDLAQPESIRSFAQQFCKRKERLSLLVNNAGARLPFYRQLLPLLTVRAQDAGKPIFGRRVLLDSNPLFRVTLYICNVDSFPSACFTRQLRNTTSNTLGVT